MDISLYQQAIGLTVAATLTGSVALLGLILSKENKTSEFRQTWIDELRADISSLLSHLNALYIYASQYKNDEDIKYDNYKTEIIEANKALFNIKLRLNQKEKLSSELISLLDEMEGLYNSVNNKSSKKHSELENEIITKSKQILKKEWNRVRNGEVVFQSARAVSFSFAISGVAAIAFYIIN